MTITTNTGTALTVGYTYSDDMLTAIQTGSTTDSFSYGDFALRSSTKIGSRTLASYSYLTDGNHYLTSLDYGNGDIVDYSYDKYGNVTKETYEATNRTQILYVRPTTKIAKTVLVDEWNVRYLWKPGGSIK